MRSDSALIEMVSVGVEATNCFPASILDQLHDPALAETSPTDYSRLFAMTQFSNRIKW